MGMLLYDDEFVLFYFPESRSMKKLIELKHQIICGKIYKEATKIEITNWFVKIYEEGDDIKRTNNKMWRGPIRRDWKSSNK